MNEKTKVTALQWLHQLWDAAVKGGAGSALAMAGTGIAHQVTEKVKMLDIHQMGVLFLSGAAFELLRFLANKPSPDVLEHDETNTTDKP